MKQTATVTEVDPIWSQTRIAQWLGMDRGKVSQALINVEPAMSRGNQRYYRLRDAIRCLYENYDELDPANLSPKSRKDWFDSEAQRLKVEKEKRLLVSIDEYRDSLASILKEIARDLESWPDRLERRHNATPELVELIEQFVDESREKLYQKLTAEDANPDAE